MYVRRGDNPTFDIRDGPIFILSSHAAEPLVLASLISQLPILEQDTFWSNYHEERPHRRDRLGRRSVIE